ncbi:MAG: hypothetical protein HY538_00415 [Deltaproteobacteria bacterium]|nr:hypothetical protein [Deltaproteobacteria bacterium]
MMLGSGLNERFLLFFTICANLIASGCFNLDKDGVETQGLALTIAGEGPKIHWEPYPEEPGTLPDAPFPNNAGAIYDSTSPTQRRLNISIENVETNFEKTTRGHINYLDGFGTTGPIWLSFDKPLDLKTVYRNSQNSVVLMQLKDCGRYPVGTVFPVDMGEGNYPTQLQSALLGEWHEIFANDPNKRAEDTLFNSEPDVDGDGECDYDEDINQDGRCNFTGNYFDLDGDGDLDYVDFYETETNTLIIRPIFPLEEQCEYGVFLNRKIKGLDGYPIQSPFKYINHTTQTEALKPAIPYLQQLGIQTEDIAFAWNYTTGTQTELAQALAQAPFGKGIFAHFEKDYPAEITYLSDAKIEKTFGGKSQNPYIIKTEPFQPMAAVIFTIWAGGGETGGTEMSPTAGLTLTNLLTDYVDYTIWGAFRTPLLTSQPNDFPDTPETEQVLTLDYRDGTDLRTGKIPVFGEENVTFLCSIPKERPELGIEAPFPVVFAGHGFASSRLKALILSGPFARHGFAVCGMDAPEHGPTDKLRIENLVPFLCNHAGICNDSEAKKAIEALVKSNLIEAWNPNEEECIEHFGKPCEEASTAELLAEVLKESADNISEASADIADGICKIGIYNNEDLPGVYSPATAFMKTILSSSDFSENCSQNLTSKVALLLTTISKFLSTVDDSKIEAFIQKFLDATEETALLLTKHFLIRQTSLYCSTSKMSSGDFSTSADIVDLIEDLWSCPFFDEIIAGDGRAKAIGLRGQTLSAGKMFDPTNPFHTRANAHQAILDQSQFIQTILHFTGVDAKGNPSALNGDFNEDGKVDLGGPFFLTGSSLGGIFSNLNGSLNPLVSGTFPISGGAELSDIVVRTFQDPFWQVAFGGIFCAPCVAGRPTEDGNGYQLFLTFADMTEYIHPDQVIPEMKALSDLTTLHDSSVISQLAGGTARLENLKNGDKKAARIDRNSKFRLTVATDEGDPLRLTLQNAQGETLFQQDLSSPIRGYGVDRNTPRFRRLLHVSHHILDDFNGANYVSHYFNGDIPYNDPTGFVIKNRRFPGIDNDRALFNVCSVGDSNVPISSCMYGRFYGAWDYAFNEKLIENGLLKGAVGKAFVNESGKICMRGNADCRLTHDNQGNLCPLDEEGNSTPCYDIIPWAPDPIVWNPNNAQSPPEGCSPADPQAPNLANWCAPMWSSSPNLDGSLLTIPNDPNENGGPLPPTEVGEMADGKSIEASAGFAFIDGTTNHHGLNAPDIGYKIPMPDGSSIRSDTGTFLTNQASYFFRTGKKLYDPCLENDTCDSIYEDYLPPLKK